MILIKISNWFNDEIEEAEVRICKAMPLMKFSLL